MMTTILKHRIQGHSLTITTPDLAPDAAPGHYAYTLKITGAELMPADVKLTP